MADAPEIVEFRVITCDNNKMKLSESEAAGARKRGEAYENDLAIEGIFLSAEDREIINAIERQRMGYDEGVRYAIARLKERGVIPAETAPEVAE